MTMKSGSLLQQLVWQYSHINFFIQYIWPSLKQVVWHTRKSRMYENAQTLFVTDT